MAKKERMGSGLDMLFEDNFHEENSGGDIKTLRISFIEPDKDQPRKNFNEQKLNELAENISEHGVLQPILVRPLDNGSYRIVAGERRWRAARIAGLTEVPVIIREFDDIQAAQIALIENLQREDLDPIEEAQAYRRLMDEFGMTQEQVSKSVGKSRSGIANAVRLLSLPEDVREMISHGMISVGHAKVLCGIGDEEKLRTLSALAGSGISVRELEAEVDKMNTLKKFPEPKKKTEEKLKEYSDPFNKYAAETALSIRQQFGADAYLSKEKNGSFSLKLTFMSREELEEFVGKLSEISE
ncbi:MAG: ParB/RepB/Spo0J family partition protein [Ruminococcus sp.]|nr:ParB/RepB/Spo0J family partition protein [Ruminococcus sp.]